MRWVAAIFAVVLTVQAAPVYRLTNLGNFDGRSAVALDISNSGAIAGEGVSARHQSYAASWNSADSVLLGTSASADAVNVFGDIAGTSWSDGGARATVWRDGTAEVVLPGEESYGLGINDAGQVAGAAVQNGRMQGFVTGPDGVQRIATPGWWSSAYDLNNYGQAVGTFGAGLSFQAFSWTQAGGVTSLGTLGGSSSYAMSVSDSGLIAGSSTTAWGYLHAFLYDGVMRDLGTLGGRTSAAYGVNVHGHAVGYSYDGSGRQRGFVWYEGMLYDLNQLIDPASEWTIDAAYGINDLGQIAGSAVYRGAKVAVLLDPVLPVPSDPPVPDVSAVPEPATGLLAAAAAVLWLGFRRLKRP